MVQQLLVRLAYRYSWSNDLYLDCEEARTKYIHQGSSN
jgi:hypothetical protein